MLHLMNSKLFKGNMDGGFYGFPQISIAYKKNPMFSTGYGAVKRYFTC